VLERPHEPVAVAPRGRPACHVAAVELDLARRRAVEAAEHVHERRLAGAVRADQADDLARMELERDVGQRLDALERPRDGGGPQRACGPPVLLGDVVAHVRA
jgi:hypothetical protein